MIKEEAVSHLKELLQNGNIPDNFDSKHPDYDKALEHTIKNNGFDYDKFMDESAIIKFGVWQVQSYALIGKFEYDYIITGSRVWETADYNGHLVWSWLIHLAKKTWITLENVNDLNTAFFFCQDYFHLLKPNDLPCVSTSQTLNIQKQILEIDEEMKASRIVSKEGIIQVDNERMVKYMDLVSNIKYI